MSVVEFENKIGRRFRIWLDDLPGDALISSETARETKILKGGLAIACRKRVAIEVFQPFGASFHYGLLGGEYYSVSGDYLKVITPVNTPIPERYYTNSLVRSLGVATIGALPEYAAAVYAALEQPSFRDRPSGVLDLTCMAHSAVGSAPIIFGSLARALLVSLCRADQPGSLDEAMALLAA